VIRATGEENLVLPCRHESSVTNQVQPTIELLTDMDVLHPDVLLDHGIRPIDYKQGLVFRSAIESIRESFIASSVTGREGLVGSVLARLLRRGYIADYDRSSSRQRYDFAVAIEYGKPTRWSFLSETSRWMPSSPVSLFWGTGLCEGQPFEAVVSRMQRLEAARPVADG